MNDIKLEISEERYRYILNQDERIKDLEKEIQNVRNAKVVFAIHRHGPPYPASNYYYYSGTDQALDGLIKLMPVSEFRKAKRKV